MIDITAEQKQVIVGIIRQFAPGVEIRVFGSRFTGTAKPYSDLDLALAGKDKLDIRLIARIKEAFEESPLPFRVDVLDWNAITVEFRKVIEEKGFEAFES
jgi:predicted nucleotidyltransferase